jgi:hypothetical protein
MHSSLLVAAKLCVAVGIPQFEEYPAREVFSGPLTQPVFADAHQRSYRTRILEGAKQGANFAGHYAAVSFGCGSNCGMMFLVDLKTGSVHKPPLSAPTNPYILAMASMLGPDPGFQANSSLFKLSSCEDSLKQICYRYSFEWNRKRWILLHRLPLPPQDGRLLAPPRFEDYPVSSVFKGKPAPPRFLLPEELLYRSSILAQIQQGANFAGHYRIVGTACGSYPWNRLDVRELENWPDPQASGRPGGSWC